MDLIELVKKYQHEILDNGILIKYDIFFAEAARKHCVFAIDEFEELNMLNSVFLNLKEKDGDAEIYVNTYGIDFTKDNIFIYADTVWIDSKFNVEEIYDFFRGYPIIEPCEITSLADDEAKDEAVSLVVSAEYRIEDYQLFINKRQINMIKSLYWD